MIWVGTIRLVLHTHTHAAKVRCCTYGTQDSFLLSHQGTAGNLVDHVLPHPARFLKAGTLSYPEAYFKIRAALELPFHHLPTATQMTVMLCHTVTCYPLASLLLPARPQLPCLGRPCRPPAALCCTDQWTTAHDVIMPHEIPVGWFSFLFLLFSPTRHGRALGKPDKGAPASHPCPGLCRTSWGLLRPSKPHRRPLFCNWVTSPANLYHGWRRWSRW